MVTTMPLVKRWLGPAAVLLLLRAVPSCSSDDASTLPTTIELEEVPGVLAKAACDVTVDCLGNAAADVAAVRKDCVKRFTRRFEDGEFALLADAIDADHAAFDKDAIAACTEAVANAGCDALTTRLTSLCPDLVTGTLGAGDECAIDAECEAGHFCRMEASCPGTCTALLAADEACEVSDDCQDGLLCSTSHTCFEPAREGDACGGDSGKECAPNAVCTGGSATEPGTCTSLDDVFSGEEGDTCEIPNRMCREGLGCAAVSVDVTNAGTSVTFQCEAPGDGTACHVAIPEACPDDTFCVLSADSADGECQPLPDDDEPCGAVATGGGASRCKSDAVCVAGTCRSVKRLGGACTVADECYSGVCEGNACVPTRCSAAD